MAVGPFLLTVFWVTGGTTVAMLRRHVRGLGCWNWWHCEAAARLVSVLMGAWTLIMALLLDGVDGRDVVRPAVLYGVASTKVRATCMIYGTARHPILIR